MAAVGRKKVSSTTPPSRSSVQAGNTIRVVSTRSGLSMETLRAWERRYGFPRPERREGSNRRLYSDSDLERLLAIQRAIACGYRVGDVIGKTLRQLDELAPNDGSGTSSPSSPSSPAALGELIEVLARDDVPELESRLRRAALALGPRRFVVELAHPFAVSVGQGWVDGRLEIRHEHVATECLVTQLRLMLASYQEIAARPLVLLATFPGEAHTLPLQMIAVYLVALGAKPRLLGGSTPAAEIIDSARALRANVVGLTVTTTSDRAQAQRGVRGLLAALPANVQIWLGGGGAAALGNDDERVRIVTSWEAVDQAVASWRS